MILPNQVPVFILAGGLGTRLSEETVLRPKPMVDIGDYPILIHIMRWYYHFGFDDFVICAGYKSWEIKNYFLNYKYRVNDLMLDHREDLSTIPSAIPRDSIFAAQEKWRVRVVDTGDDCMTGARLARAFDIVSKEAHFPDFAVTYGDGLTNADLGKELQFHLNHNKVGTVLGVNSTQRFGILDIKDDLQVTGFVEKPTDRHDVINGGFFFFKKVFRKYIDSEKNCVLERLPIEKIALEDQLRVFKHLGFWQPMDTLRDKNNLEELWKSGKAPWSQFLPLNNKEQWSSPLSPVQPSRELHPKI